MHIEDISRAAERTVAVYKEDDPFRLQSAMGILLLRTPMGTADTSCKGFYMTQSRKQIITINSDLPEPLQRVVLAHELGHGVLHRGARGMRAFHEFSLFDETSKMEYEANLFAAELLLRDEDVLALLNDDISFFGAAGALSVPPELLDFKFRVMKRKGCKVTDPPLMAKSCFLKDI
ncbi:MAG: ImmA/IrrE family metallo-endopeptidase [Oscillospiraceae bacterium]